MARSSARRQTAMGSILMQPDTVPTNVAQSTRRTPMFTSTPVRVPVAATRRAGQSRGMASIMNYPIEAASPVKRIRPSTAAASYGSSAVSGGVHYNPRFSSTARTSTLVGSSPARPHYAPMVMDSSIVVDSPVRTQLLSAQFNNSGMGVESPLLHVAPLQTPGTPSQNPSTLHNTPFNPVGRSPDVRKAAIEREEDLTSARLAQSQAALDRERGNIAYLQNQLASLKTEKNVVDGELQQNLQENQSTSLALQQATSQLQSASFNNQALATENTTLELHLQQRENELMELRSQLASTKAQYNEEVSRASLTANQATLTAAEKMAEAVQLGATNNSLATENQRFQAQMLMARADRHRRSIGFHEEHKLRMEAEDTLTNTAAAMDQEIVILRQQVQDFQVQAATREREYNSVVSELSTTQKEVGSLQGLYANAQDVISMMTELNTAANAENAELRSKIFELEKNVQYSSLQYLSEAQTANHLQRDLTAEKAAHTTAQQTLSSERVEAASKVRMAELSAHFAASEADHQAYANAGLTQSLQDAQASEMAARHAYETAEADRKAAEEARRMAAAREAVALSAQQVAEVNAMDASMNASDAIEEAHHAEAQRLSALAAARHATSTAARETARMSQDLDVTNKALSRERSNVATTGDERDAMRAQLNEVESHARALEAQYQRSSAVAAREHSKLNYVVNNTSSELQGANVSNAALTGELEQSRKDHIELSTKLQKVEMQRAQAEEALALARLTSIKARGNTAPKVNAVQDIM